MTESRKGAYGAEDHIVDYILGITFEIWEERGVDLIHQYYGPDCVVWGLDGITHGAAEVVDATWATLAAFPDRLLLAEDVIWSGSREDGFYSSHRLLSTATNEGSTVYGPATGSRIRMTNIADCLVEDGVITKEWLVRDNMTLALQLGADPIAAAAQMAGSRTSEHQSWIDAETQRLGTASPPEPDVATRAAVDPMAFAWRVLTSLWRGDREDFDAIYAPYCVLHRSPMRCYSGRNDVFAYYHSLRDAFGEVRYSVDHVASQPFSDSGVDIAVRWTVAGSHVGEVMGVSPSGKPIFVMGVTHWRCIADRIIIERTVFDDLAVLSQMLAS